MSDERLLIYVAGPYTHPDPVANTHIACKAGTELIERGFWAVVPHTSLMWHAVTPLPYQTWLDLDLAVLERCDAVLRLPGESSGADGEVKRAEELNIHVAFSIEDLECWRRALDSDGMPPPITPAEVQRLREEGYL